MGLDMYLTKKVYVGANYDHNNVTGKVTLKKDGKPIKVNVNKITYIEEEFMYWRKANAIHKFFVDNVQNGNDDCKPYYVSTEVLKDLYNRCCMVLADHSKAPELLPSQSGFFFGSTDYDEWYFEDIKSTAEVLKDVEEEDNVEYEYESSW